MSIPGSERLYATGWPRSGRGWWALGASTGLAAIVLLVLPGRKRYRAALGLGLVSVLSFALGCGSNGGGAVATTTKITLNGAAKGASTSDSFGFSIAVTGGPPDGQGPLLDGGATPG